MLSNSISMSILLEEYYEKEADITAILEQEALDDQIMDKQQKSVRKNSTSSFYMKKLSQEELQRLIDALIGLMSTFYAKQLTDNQSSPAHAKELFEKIMILSDLLMEAADFNYLKINGKDIQRKVNQAGTKQIPVEGIRGPHYSSYSAPMQKFRAKLLSEIIKTAVSEDQGFTVVNNELFKTFYIKCSLYIIAGLQVSDISKATVALTTKTQIGDNDSNDYDRQDSLASRGSNIESRGRLGSDHSKGDSEWIMLGEEEQIREERLDLPDGENEPTINSEFSESPKAVTKSSMNDTVKFQIEALEATRIDSEGNWMDKELYCTLLKSMDTFFQFKNFEGFLMSASSTTTSMSKDLIFTAQINKDYKPALFMQLFSLLQYGIIAYGSAIHIDIFKIVIENTEKLFLNLLLLDEIHRKSFQIDKSKQIEVAIVGLIWGLRAESNQDKSGLQQESEIIDGQNEILSIITDCRNSIMKMVFRSYLTKLDFKVSKSTNNDFVLANSELSGEASLFSFTADLIEKKFRLIEPPSNIKPKEEVSFQQETAALGPSSPLQSLFSRSLSQIKEESLSADQLLSIQAAVSKLYNAEDILNDIKFWQNTSITKFLASSTQQLRLGSMLKKYRALRGKINDSMVESAFRLEAICNTIESVIREHEHNYQRVLNYLKNKIEISGISAESVMRSCRFAANKMTRDQRDINGLWCTQQLKNYLQIDQMFSSEYFDYQQYERNMFYDFGVENYATAQKTRPFLKFELRRYWSDNYDDIFKDDDKDGPKSIYFALNSRSPKQKKSAAYTKRGPSQKTGFYLFQSKRNRHQSKYKSNIYELEDQASDESYNSDGGKVIFGKRCQLIEKFKIWKGFLYLIKDKLFFYIDTFEISNYFSSSTKDLKSFDKLKRIWNISSIRDMKVRRLNQRRSAIELFFKDGYSVFFNFNACIPADSDLQNFFQKLKTVMSIYNAKIDTTRLLNFNHIKHFETMKLTDRWLKGDLSNFEYLLDVNLYSGRSYNDLSQYPVFPWVFMVDYIKDKKLQDFYSSSPDQFMSQLQIRDLTKNMGTLGDPQRLANYTKRYNSARYFDSHVPPYHYGSHYSTPAVVIYYLLRLYPFTEGAIDFQSGVFDIADRLFHSVQKCFKNAMEEMSDVRELIPEFFFMPELLLNINKLNLGLLHTDERVNCVELPQWTDQNPYIFTYMLRKILESKEVTMGINQWIDLVFGFKQIGQEALENNNVFYYLTYEGQIDMDSLDKEDKDAIETQVLHFGQTPSQLFTRPHPQMPDSSIRFFNGLNKEDNKMMLYKRTHIESQLKRDKQFPIRGIFLNPSYNPKQMVACIRGPIIDTYYWETKTAKDIHHTNAIPFKLAFNTETSFSDWYQTEGIDFTDQLMFQNKEPPLVYSQERKLLVIGGLLTGSVSRL